MVRAACCPDWIATCAKPWQPVEAHQVADDEDLGVPGNREVRLDLHPSRPIHLGAGLLGEQSAERRRLHAGGPDLGGRLDAMQLGDRRVCLETALVHVGDGGAHVNLDPDRTEVAHGALPERLRERGKDRRPCVQQQHARLRRVDVPKVPAQRPA
jgi:hypothetical protein